MKYFKTPALWNFPFSGGEILRLYIYTHTACKIVVIAKVKGKAGKGARRGGGGHAGTLRQGCSWKASAAK